MKKDHDLHHAHNNNLATWFFFCFCFFWPTDLSSYVPKHSVDFSTWQEHKHNNSVNQEDSTAHQTQMTEEVMVSPTTSVHPC